MSDNLKEHFDSILRKVDNLSAAAESLKIALRKLESEFLKPDYSQVEGITGTFNGYEIVTDKGDKVPVPQNYAAKSRLVYGDVLKKIDEDGKSIFKQVQKVERQQVEGILTKKEGEWYLLTDRGSYKVLDTAAEFLKAELNSEALAFIPADNREAPFATLDKLISTQYLVNTAFQYPQQNDSNQGENKSLKSEPARSTNDQKNRKSETISTPPKAKPNVEKITKVNSSTSQKSLEKPAVTKSPARNEKQNKQNIKKEPVVKPQTVSSKKPEQEISIDKQTPAQATGRNFDDDDLI